jgi:hypothetical protein
MFPLWFVLVFPMTWLIIMPVNFIIDTIILIIGLKCFKINEVYETYKKVVLKVWIFGFLVDIIGSGVIFLLQFLQNEKENSLYAAVTNHVAWNPFYNFSSSVTVIIAICISILLLYLFNFKISFKKVGLEKKKAKKLAVLVAIFTAPWMLMVPTHILYNSVSANDPNNISNNQVVDDYKSIEIRNALNALDVSTYIEDGVYDSTDLKLSVNCNITTNDEAKLKEYQKLFESDTTDELLNYNAKQLFNDISSIDDVIFKVSDDKTYEFSRENIN